MAIRIQNLPDKGFNEGVPVLSMPNFNYPSWWASNEHQVPLSLSGNVSFKAESPPQKKNHETKALGFQLVEQESSSTQSISHSQSGGAISQDQSVSSESGQVESCGKSVEGQMKPVFLYTNSPSDIKLNPSHSDHTHQMVHVPYPPPDPYFAGLMAAYGPHAIIQPQIGSQAIAVPPTRVPLPLNLPEDGPIYVNAKQYHGILRRRQSRAKLEAQNKLVKTRKPYLHESRHLHALNRVRGSGGRFLSTKKLQQDHSSGQTNHHFRGNERFTPTTTCSETTSITNCETFFHHSDRHLPGISSSVGVRRSGGGLLDTSRLRSSSVR